MSRLRRWLAPEDVAQEQTRHLEILGFVNGGIVLAGLAALALSFPLGLLLLRLAMLVLLAASAIVGLKLRRRFWIALDHELRLRKLAEQKARAADVTKGQFLSSVSHEIRTPMNAVLGMAELLLARPLPDGVGEQVEIIRSSSEALLAVVNDLLDLSQMEAGRLRLRPRDFSWRTLAEEVLRLLASRAAQQSVRLSLEIDPALPDALHGDPVRLRQVLLNLVGNGIRFTRDGTVSLKAGPRAGDPATLRCEVRDTGVGIPLDVQARLFQPYVRESSSANGLGGTGLGLVITRNIVELMGGRIGFESTRGVGTTFWFEIPLSAARNPLRSSEPAPHDDPLRRQARRARRVLVVDDRAANRSVALALLENLGYGAEAVESGEQALATLAATTYAAVLLDAEMPGLDGLETCRRLRSRENPARRTPVIALSAHTREEHQQRFFAAGMDAFLPKPFDTCELGALLDAWTGVEAGPAPEPPAGSPATSDVGLESRLAELRSGAAGAAPVAEIVDAFLGQAEADLASMRRAVAQGDGETLAALAHALAGSAAILGAQDLARSAGELARLARDGALSACVPRVAEAEQAYHLVAHRLRA